MKKTKLIQKDAQLIKIDTSKRYKSSDLRDLADTMDKNEIIEIELNPTFVNKSYEFFEKDNNASS